MKMSKWNSLTYEIVFPKDRDREKGNAMRAKEDRRQKKKNMMSKDKKRLCMSDTMP